MSTRGRPDQTGRSSGKLNGRAGKRNRPPEGEPFVWLTQELIASDAWRTLSINGRRLLEFLMIEHMNHGGLENGNLVAPYEQLVAFGITRRLVNPTIDELKTRGLVDVQRAGMRSATRFALTWLPIGHMEPTNRWRRYRETFSHD